MSTSTINALSLDGPDCGLLREVLDLLPSGAFFIDAGCRITSWNKQMSELTGFSREEVLGKHCSVMEGDRCFASPEDENCDMGSQSCALFSSCSILGRRCRVRRKNGTWVNVVKYARLLHDENGQVIGGVETVTDITELVGLEDELARLRRDRSGECAGNPNFYGFVGRHPSMQRLYDLLATAGPSDSAVLIRGETGAGKGVAARAIHQMSRRHKGPFVRVSCTALSESLLESELFGHVRGAFTGAVAGRVGRFEAADGGTLFLDEIGDISPKMQTMLLRVLEELEFERVGSNRSIRVDTRVVAATHRDLQAMCEEGTFRSDLYYRLAVIPIHVPPLRERLEDVPLLVNSFLQQIHERGNTVNAGIDADAMSLLSNYRWPGNVRELLHALEYSVVISGENPIGWTTLPPAIQAAAVGNGRAVARRSAPPAVSVEPRAVASRSRRRHPQASREQILQALRATDGHRAEAAARLGVSRMTLWKWMRGMEIQWPPAP